MTFYSGQTSSDEEMFVATLEDCLQADNDKRTTAESIYNEISDEKKFILLISTIRNPRRNLSIRSFAGVMIRRLIQTQFDSFWPKYSDEQKAELKKEFIVRLTQIDQDETIRKKICYAVAEMAKKLINDSGCLEWNEILEFVIQSTNSSHSVLKESALIVFESFPGIFGGRVEPFTQHIHQMFLTSLNDQEARVRYGAATAFISYLTFYSSNSQLLNIYRDCLSSFLNVAKESLSNPDDDSVLKALIDLAENLPKYLRPSIDELFNMCLTAIEDKDEFEESHRHLALEVLVTLSETSSGMVRKLAKKYMPRLVPQLLEMMVDLDDDSQWSQNDTIDEEDDDSNAVVGESSLDRLSCALGGKTMINYILSTVQTMLQNPDWRYRHAGLMAISATGEGCHKEMSLILDELVNGILVFLKDSHPRVRYAACNALGQMSTDFQGTFQKKFHSKVIPGLLSILDDHENPRTQAHGGAALVNFAEDCPARLLIEHLPKIIDKLEQVLTRKYQELVQHNRKLVLEQIVTTLAAIADTVEHEFSPYYDRFMPQLKYLFKNATTPEYRMLRGKTMECISLIGLAVGKDKFINDCYEIMQELVKSQVDFDNLANDDPQVSYLIGAWTRICKILGKDFEQYLPIVMGPVLKAASFKPEVTVLSDGENDIDEDESWEVLNVGDQAFGIKTTGLEEKSSACSMLVCYARELKDGFVDYVEETTKLMVPLLRFYFHEGVRIAAGESLPHLLECARLKGDDYLKQMWQYINKELFKAIEIEPDHEVLGELFSSMGKCIEILGAISLSNDELKELTTILDGHLRKHFDRSNERAEKRRDEDHDDEAEEEMAEEDEYDAYVLNRLSDIIHSLLVTYKESYLPHFDVLVQHFYGLLQENRSVSDRQWALCVFDDVIQFTGSHSHRYSQFFLSKMGESLSDPSPEIRQASAYGFGVMAMNGGPVYGRACAESLPRLFTLISSPQSRSIENNAATENAISAVSKILKYNNACLENIDKLHQVWLSWFPVYEDVEEAPHVYGYLCDLIESNNPVVIGEENSNVPNLVKIFADAFGRSSVGPSSIVGQRMILILRHVQTIPSIFQSCMNILDEKQRNALANAMNSSTLSH